MDRWHPSDYDAVVLADNCVACFAPLVAPKRPVLLLKHSVQAVDARDERLRAGRWNLKGLLQQCVVGRQERRTCRAAHKVCCVHQEDAQEVANRYGVQGALVVIPIGVEPAHFVGRSFDPGNETIAFFGNMSWGANVDAVSWLAEQALPFIWRRRPKAQFRIIRQGSQDLPLHRADPRIQCMGRVPDVPEALRDVTVGVVPIVSGSDIRFKLLELLAMGRPTVTTFLGLAGTRSADGKQCMVADSPCAFADAVLLLLSNGALRMQLSEASRKALPTWNGNASIPKSLRHWRGPPLLADRHRYNLDPS